MDFHKAAAVKRGDAHVYVFSDSAVAPISPLLFLMLWSTLNPRCAYCSPRTVELLDEDRRALRRKDGSESRLGPVTWRIMTVLWASRNRGIRAAVLYDAVYGGSLDPPEENVVKCHISRLRRCLVGTGWRVDIKLGRYQLKPEEQ